MSSWVYCRTCGEGLGKPTMYEVIAERQNCSRGHHNQPTINKDDMLVEMYNRIEILEAIVIEMRKRLP